MTPNRGYLLPDTVDPEDSLCVILHIPDEQKHVAAFWGALETLKKWYSWERDVAKTGKDVALVWNTVIEDARTLWATGECPMEVRTNPTDPCEHQYSIDGGDNWITYATLTDCGRPDEGPPFEGDPDAASDTAANIAIWFDTVMCIMVTGIDDGDADSLIIGNVNAWYSAYTSTRMPVDSILAMLYELRLLTPVQRADYCSGDLADDIYDYMMCTETVLEPETGEILDIISDWLANALTTWSAWLSTNLSAAARHLNIGDAHWIVSSAGEGGGAGFADPSCTWQHDFDFTGSTDWFGWETAPTNTASIAYNSPTHGLMGLTGGVELDEDISKSLAVSRTFDARVITLIRVKMWIDKVTTSTPTARAFFTNAPENYEEDWNTLAEGDPVYITRTGSRGMSEVKVELRVALGAGHPAGVCVVREIRLEGIGSNPFV